MRLAKFFAFLTVLCIAGSGLGIIWAAFEYVATGDGWMCFYREAVASAVLLLGIGCGMVTAILGATQNTPDLWD